MTPAGRARLVLLVASLAAQCLLLGWRLRARGFAPGPLTLLLLALLALTVFALWRRLRAAAPPTPRAVPRQRLFAGVLLLVGWLGAEAAFFAAARLAPASVRRLGLALPGDGPALLGEAFFDRFFAEIFDAELGWDRPDVPASGRARAAPVTYGRVLANAYGDSFTACFGPDEETWPVHLAARLQADVINLGVEGHGPDQTLLKLRREQPRRPAPLVLFGVFSEGVARLVNVYRTALDVQFYASCTLPDGRPLFEPTKPRFVPEGGRLRLLPNPVRTRDDLRRLVHDPGYADAWRAQDFFRAGYDRERYCPTLRFPHVWSLGRAALRRVAERPRPDYAGELLRDGDALALLTALLDDARGVARAQGAELLVTLFGTRADLDQRLAHGTHGRLAGLIERLAARDLPVFDAVEALARHARGLHPPQSTEVYFDGSGHHSMLAHRVLAEALASDGRVARARARLP
jgi:hypothetical protein